MTTAQLLEAAANALDAGEDPFGGNWLAEHDVTLDECMLLAENLATGARIVAQAINDPRSVEMQAYALALAKTALT